MVFLPLPYPQILHIQSLSSSQPNLVDDLPVATTARLHHPAMAVVANMRPLRAARYNQEPTLPQLPVEQPQTQYTLGLYSQPELHSGPQYPQDPAPSYYQPGSALCDPAETRPRFGHR